jgi:hypothetical protein
VLYVKKGKRYVPASPGELLAATIGMLHEHGFSGAARTLNQQILDQHLIGRMKDVVLKVEE